MQQRFRLDVQGLRALAVVSVVLFHANERFIAGGYVGVDVFFVISGYLITGIILREIRDQKFSIAEFYRRRIRRLFPALYTMLAASAVAGALLLTPAEYQEFGKTALATVFFVSNFAFLEISGYFAGDANLKPLLHTWSLAVEEQFYIAYPIFCLIALRYARRWFPLLLVLGAIASLALSIWMTEHKPTGAFYLAPPRAFELLIGCLLAANVMPGVQSRVLRDGLSLAGIGLILGSVLLFNHYTPFPGYAALVPCIGTALVIYAGQHGDSMGGRLLSLAPFQFFGSISYSLYLWHWPILVYSRHYFLGELTPLRAAIAVAAAVLAGYLSLRFIERPFLKPSGKRGPVLGVGIGAMALGSAAALALVLTQGLPGRFSPETRTLFAGADDYNPKRARCHADGERVIPYDQSCVFGAESTPAIAIWGDSHGAELAAALGDRIGERGESVLSITASLCPPALGYEPRLRPNCRAHNQVTFDQLKNDSRIKIIVLTANLIGYDENWNELAEGYRKAVLGLTAAGKRVVLVEQIPIMDFDPPAALGMLETRGQQPEAYGLPRLEYAQRSQEALSLVRAVSDEAGAERIDTENLYCDDQLCRTYSPQLGSLYFNKSHLSVNGAKVLAAAIEP